MKKNRLYILIFVFLMFFCVNVGGVKAEEFDIVFKCGNATSGNCPLSIVDGELAANTNYCDISGNWGGSIENRKIHISDIDISGSSKCYKAQYTCTWDSKTHYFEIKKLKFSSTDATKNDAAKGIICPNKPLIDMCGEYTEKNFKEKCPNAPDDATYKKFRGKCDLAYQDAMDYCEGKGRYYKGGPKNKEIVQSIINAAKKWGSEEYGVSSDGTISCTALLGPENVDLISDILLIISAIAVVLLIVFEIGDFVKAVASSDDDALAQAFKKLKNRIISVVVLLMLPALVDFALGFINDNLHYEVIKSDGTIGEDVSIKVGKASDCGQ